MPIRTGRTLFTLAVTLWLGATQVAAQVQVNWVDDLRFGTVLAGVSKTVLRTDAAAAGRYDLITPRNTSLSISFTLPSVMTGPGAATLPVSFTGITAGYSESQNIKNQVGFSPTTGITQLSQDGRASVFLGGTVSPDGAQTAGSYTAPVTLTVTLF